MAYEFRGDFRRPDGRDFAVAGLGDGHERAGAAQAQLLQGHADDERHDDDGREYEGQWDANEQPGNGYEHGDVSRNWPKGARSARGGGMDMGSAAQADARMDMPAGKPLSLNYGMLRSPVRTNLPENAPTRTLRFNLTGNMNRYVWEHQQQDRLRIGQDSHPGKERNVRIILYNGTMMRHPMHLHGHFFRLLNGQGDYSPLKNTLDIMPMETDTIEFAATESGDWFFHCHILYHMMSGMGRIFSYQDSPPNPQVPDTAMALKMVYMDDRMIHPSAEVALESNGTEGNVTLANTRYRFQTEWQAGLDDRTGYQSETHIGRYLGRMQYWMPYVGWDVRYREERRAVQNAGLDKRIRGTTGRVLRGGGIPAAHAGRGGCARGHEGERPGAA